ncbi:hypothetical protein HPB49_017259 [Dermacentor silvarum]|uniref:Uncharacterized protein n=1 Tax=Dermacentor silvarum TaxID=543639 RepID=A0ACB8E1K7_DERSI|nr:hypothetical protein HPB49_017259 [Dermacentor silvarum]
MDRFQAAGKEDNPPKRPSRLTYRKERIKGGTKKSQSLPVIKTPLEELRLVHNNSVTASLTHGRASSSSDDEAFELAPSSLAENNCSSDTQTPSLRPKMELVRLSSLVKCPSSTSLNRPLSFATEQLLRQTSCVSTGSLKSLSDGTNGNYGNKPHQLAALAKTESSTGSTRCVTEVKKLHHSWTVTGMSEFQDSVDFPPDQPSILPKISTKDARLRSYLVGNVSGKGSLLGEQELNRYFPDRKVNVFVATWNMNGLASPASLDDLLLPKTIEYVPEIYAIGVQEAMSDRKEWETRLQFTLGPSHVLFYSVSLGVLNLSIFLRRDLIWFCSVSAYTTLKQLLISRLTPSEPQQLKQLLHGAELDDQTPSQLLRHMQQLLGTTTTDVDSRLLRELFLQWFPTNVQMVLALAADKQLPQLAELADLVTAVASPSIAAAQTYMGIHTSTNELQDIREQISHLADTVAAIRDSSACAEHQRAAAQPQQLRQRICWYHRKHGNAACKCIPPCDHTGNDRSRH